MTLRLAIGGGPRTGKTSRALAIGQEYGVTPRGTDELVGVLEWGEDSLEVSRWFDQPGPFIIEGVAVVRALRKWMTAHPAGKPVDALMWLDRPWTDLKPGQEAMAKGCGTILDSCRAELVKRGVLVIRPQTGP